MRSYKAARRAALREPVRFEVEYVEVLDGQEVEKTEAFACRGEMSSLVLSEMAYHADLDVESPEGMAILRQVFSTAFGDDAEYRRFFKFMSRYGDEDQLMDILAGLVEDFTGRPTERPSTSQQPLSPSGHSSKGAVLPFNVERKPVEVIQVTEDLDQVAAASSS